MINRQIRLLLTDDVDDYWQLRLRALREEPEAFGTAYEESVLTPIEDIAERLIVSDDSFVLGAYEPDLAGLVGYYRETGIKRRHKGNVFGMYVIPEARGQGTAHALMSALIDRASKIDGLEQLILSVVASNESAARLYRSLGFKSYGVEPRALRSNSNFLDEELMMLSLV